MNTMKRVQTGPAQDIVLFLLLAADTLGRTLLTDGILLSILCVFANEHHRAIECQKVGANRSRSRHYHVSLAWIS